MKLSKLLVLFIVLGPSSITTSCIAVGVMATCVEEPKRFEFQVFHGHTLLPLPDVNVEVSPKSVLRGNEIPPTDVKGKTVFIYPGAAYGRQSLNYMLFFLIRIKKISKGGPPKFAIKFNKKGFWEEELHFPKDFGNRDKVFYEKKVLLTPLSGEQ